MPLTTEGLTVQILSSIRAFRQYRTQCTTNDCKVVLNHLLRKFSEPLVRKSQLNSRQSKAVVQVATDNTVEDHAVPVAVLVEHLLTIDDSNLEPSAKNIAWFKQFLIESLVLVEVTRKEDLALSACGLQRQMPNNWSIGADNFGRYKEAGTDV